MLIKTTVGIIHHITYSMLREGKWRSFGEQNPDQEQDRACKMMELLTAAEADQLLIVESTVHSASSIHPKPLLSLAPSILHSIMNNVLP